MGLVAAIIGASGLVGAHVLDDLLADPAYQRVVAAGRNRLPREHPKLVQAVGDLAHLDSAALGPVDTLFCCLGTTIKTAGSRAAFRRVDHDYPMRFAAAGLASGAEHFLLVSAVGANPSSSAFYSRVKGELERDLADADYSSLSIFRPSLLLGHRAERRTGERIAQAILPPLNPMLVGPLRRYRAIHAATVAQAMVNRAHQYDRGTRVLEYDQIEELARGEIPLAMLSAA
jgi:uncharacterized protein YbjT (DUF2867 family)